MEIIYWNDKLEKFIEGLDPETRMRIDRTRETLEQLGHLIDMPDSKSLGQGLFELRLLGKKQVRLLYIFKNNKAYILHGFVKKTWKISNKDIKYARRVQKEVNELA
jgi:phage-related protein